MTRQPQVASAAAMLRNALAADGIMLAHQKALNLAAKLFGFKNWAQAQATPASAAAPTPEPTPASTKPTQVSSLPTREEELETALRWVSRNYLTTLGGKPVRDADECLLYAERLLKNK